MVFSRTPQARPKALVQVIEKLNHLVIKSLSH
jgi:hypothetical protein